MKPGDRLYTEAEMQALREQLETAEAMCRDIVKRNPPSALIDTWATVNKAQEFLASFPAKRWPGATAFYRPVPNQETRDGG